ncbi:bifunctional helix-turn-helix transcriptional regulator/GNAT family N-acetyltransferase [Tenacibaculum sp. IB213877]|uniref:bifunctional helix-turn-helix transcriptional regulator/GNAT family N-acetyltransferase n=1 Tax=Tenacibaculum sp. IB213877 TaxID=3097351 RepID=UPI002A5AA8A5|nr:bifunctional helix-turn-helix transcriptional regulator/GNAT family N-acetyltransferase [Tenacibaculum sp. IB213877]MDY0779993.1 bifunctional helix-turn-helix transcriptional regulator/GNAT family N-acetyltransferase [Tenacibaculum sp. IB213877]
MDALQGLGETGMGSRLKRLSEYLMRETQVVYDEFNIDFDPYLFPTLKVIMNKEKVTNTEINSSLKTTQPATTQAINKLVKKGLVNLKEDKNDKRKKIISLSKKGKELIEKMSPIWKSIEHTLVEYTSITSNSLVEHINILEKKFDKKDFSAAIIEHVKMNNSSNLEIVTYKNSYAKNFYDLNIEWLTTYFYVEPYDEEVLSKPEKYIVNKGGHIFFAKLNNEVVGTVALMPMEETNVFELTKMAVSPNHRGHKIGQQLMQHCINFSKENKFEKLVLYSNRILENAIYIYRKYGFVEVAMEPNSPYKRGDIKMELKLLNK